MPCFSACLGYKEGNPARAIAKDLGIVSEIIYVQMKRRVLTCCVGGRCHETNRKRHLRREWSAVTQSDTTDSD